MRIKVVTIGKLKHSFIREGESEYLKRLPSHVKVSFLELEPAQKGRDNSDIEKIKEWDSQAVLSQVDSGGVLVVLDEGGKSFDSKGFAAWLEKSMVQGRSRLTFAIGGAYGWSDSIRERADLVLSLSPLTFNYQLSRLVLVEQLYRAFSILEGSPYHKA